MAETYIHPSNFNRRISVQVPITLVDAGGGIGTTGYETEYTTWASVDELSANRLAFYGMDLFQTAWEIKLRYNTDRIITTGTVIEYEGRKIIAKAVHTIRQGNKRFLIVICIESATT